MVTAFQPDAYQNDSFQITVAVGGWAFQPCAFQYDAFQTGFCSNGGPPPIVIAPTPDRFRGPAPKQGPMGWLAIERELSDYNFDTIIAVSGCQSETVTITGEKFDGTIMAYPQLRYYKTGKKLDTSVVQNGTYVITQDDMHDEWDAIGFIKSGPNDRIKLTIDSLFGFIEAPR